MKELLDVPNFIHGFSTKNLGNMSFNWGDSQEVLNNRKTFLSKLGIDINSCVSTKLEDSNNITVVSNEDKGKRMFDKELTIVGDGLITKENNLFLFVVVGDCLPCIIFDQKQKILALLHLSWKCTEAKLCAKTIQKFLSEYNSNPNDIFVAIGPGIHKESHIFKNPIQKSLPGWENFLQDLPDGNTSIDVVGYNICQCENLGISHDHIFISDINTAKDNTFFSHFRDSKSVNTEGRFACVVGFKK